MSGVYFQPQIFPTGTGCFSDSVISSFPGLVPGVFTGGFHGLLSDNSAVHFSSS
jgi:hypothetical protein